MESIAFVKDDVRNLETNKALAFVKKITFYRETFLVLFNQLIVRLEQV